MSTLTTSKKLPAKLPAQIPAGFEELCNMHRPRLIADKIEAGRAKELVRRLAMLPTRTTDQQDYYDLLARLVLDWQEFSEPRKRLSPAELIRGVMDEQKMTQAAMAQIMGITQGHLSTILAGSRGVSKASAKRFAERFKVNPAALI